jgi:TctA family transporter
MVQSAIADLLQGFGVALQLDNLTYCVLGIVLGQVIGVLPGIGPLAAISLLLPLTFAMKPVAAILMLAGIFYGSQYGGAICAILLNLPVHATHAVTCLDGYPLTRQGRGGAALGVAVIAAFIGASFGITEMIFFAPVLTRLALQFSPADICSIMLLGLLAGSTMARGSPVKGIAMTMFGVLLGMVGMDPYTAAPRFTFGAIDLLDGVKIVALALGLFGIAEFLKNVNQLVAVQAAGVRLRLRDMVPSRQELRHSALPIIRGTIIGSLCSLIPGTGVTIASFVAYAAEKKVSKRRDMFGHGAIEGVAAPEAANHSSVQGDFIPTMSLGIPGDAVMALILGALIIQGVQPGPELIVQHPDIFWGLVASFWIGNIILVILNVPMISVWVKLLNVPYRFLYPAALLFICMGVYSANNSFFDVGETFCIGILGYILLMLDFHAAPILLGYILGPRVEENFRRSMVISEGDISVFVHRPISAIFISLCAALLVVQMILALRRSARASVVA